MMKNELPEGWAECELGDIIKVSSGDGLTSTNMNKEGKIPVYGGNGITGYHDKSNTNEETIVIGRVGYYCGSIHLTPKKAWVTDNALKVSFSQINIEKRFLFWLLKFLDLGQYSGSSAQPVISGAKIYKVPINLPPFAEQNRIVAKIDALFEHFEPLRISLIRIPELIKSFHQTVLAQAVTGKLTVGWREANPDLNSLDTLDLVQRKNTNKNQQAIKIFKDDSLNPFEIPDVWTFFELRDLSYNLSYGTSEKSLNEGLVPVLRMGNLQNGKIDWTDLKYTSSSSEIKKYTLKKGDVLFNRTNSPELVGKTSIYESDLPAIYAGYLIKIESYEELNSYFLNYVLNSQYGRSWSWSVKTDGVSQSNINAQKLGDFLIPFPAPKEQQEIVNQVEALFAKLGELEMKYRSLKDKIDKLPQILLAKAFRGDLVPQNSADEPASMLLGNILKIGQSNKGKIKEKTLLINFEEKMKKDVRSTIEENFHNKSFSYEDLTKVTQLSYNDLSQEVINLLSNQVTSSYLQMTFSKDKNCIEFKAL